VSENDLYQVAVVNVVSKARTAMNKDLNGGFGTSDSYSGSVFEKVISVVKRRSIRLPIISLAYLMGIFKDRGISARYFEGAELSGSPSLVLVYGSIVDYRYENEVCAALKQMHPNAQVGFVGPFPSTMPELFNRGDFVICGDFEYFFMKSYRSSMKLNGQITVNERLDIDELPRPDLTGFPIAKYGYSPAITAKPFFTLLASKGCPYPCSYYCAYGNYQGSILNVRSAAKVVGDMEFLSREYGIRGFQFRDPVFGIKKGYIEELCAEIKRRKLEIEWGIETRIETLSKKKIKLMHETGLRNLNVGIETIHPEIAKNNRRVLANVRQQEELIRYCEQIGVKVSAFYIFGYEGDTLESMRATLEYAKKLNTFLARFAVCTPYPGTPFFDDLKRKGRLSGCTEIT